MSSTAEELREEVRRRYAESALRVTGESERCGCGSGSCCADAESDAAKFGEALYNAEQRGELPDSQRLLRLVAATRLRLLTYTRARLCSISAREVAST